MYRILGKKSFSKDTSLVEDKTISKKENIFADEVMDYSQKQILNLDGSFSFPDFIEGAKEAFRLIVLAYKNKKIHDVKSLLSKDVFDNFDSSINSLAAKKDKISKFSILSIKASILSIKTIKKLATIKVEFLSDQEVTVSSKIKRTANIKDIWTFQKDMENKSPIWKLIEVSAE